MFLLPLSRFCKLNQLQDKGHSLYRALTIIKLELVLLL